jgi:hypothetical protein
MLFKFGFVITDDILADELETLDFALVYDDFVVFA